MLAFYHSRVIGFAKSAAYSLIALALFALAAIPAQAEWVQTSDGKLGTSYVDFVTIGRDGNLARVWHLQELNQPGPSGEMSRQWLIAYDCSNKLLKVLEYFSYAGSMATGVSLFTQRRPGSWIFIPADSNAGGIVRKVCSASRV